eukprot:353222-Chlamydomonas_euryale.AAC.13
MTSSAWPRSVSQPRSGPELLSVDEPSEIFRSATPQPAQSRQPRNSASGDAHEAAVRYTKVRPPARTRAMLECQLRQACRRAQVLVCPCLRRLRVVFLDGVPSACRPLRIRAPRLLLL